MGLLVHVLRSSLGDCTNGGVSSKHDSFVLMDDNIGGSFTPSERYPELVLVRREIIPGEIYIHAVPKELVGTGKWVMMGGNFIYSSDSRFRDVCRYPIPLHDRVDGWR